MSTAGKGRGKTGSARRTPDKGSRAGPGRKKTAASAVPASAAPADSPAPIQVVHADDHDLFRMGLRKLLEERADMTLVASLKGPELLPALQRISCDVLLLDLSMPEADGLKLLEKVSAAHPHVRTIALTMHRDREYFRAAMARGVAGYVLKDDVFETLTDAILAVHAGTKYYSTAIRNMMVEEYELRQQAGDSVQLLTPREQEVLRLIAKGLMNKEIADRLFLSVRTVESHRAKIMHKLRIPNVQGLVRFAVQNALI